MSDTNPKPSILATAESLVDDAAVEGLAAGVVARKGEIGAEVAGKHDIGKPGGWTLGGVARISNKDKLLAILAKWTPKK